MKRLALAAAALIASLGLIAPAGADACDWRRKPASYGHYIPPGPAFTLSIGNPRPAIVYRDRPGPYYYHPGPRHRDRDAWRHRDDHGRPYAWKGDGRRYPPVGGPWYR